MDLDCSQDENLFADSDNESNQNNLRGVPRKRRHLSTENLDREIKSSQNEKQIVDAEIKPNWNKELPKSNDKDATWSIEDDTLFYPLGICSHYIAGVNKSVILIWSDFSVINFVIKKNLTTKQTKTTRVRINVPNGEEIKDIIILELNTLLLLESGRVYYFSSAKSMHQLTWLENVRSLTRAPNGFSVIRLSKKKQLVLEVYEDLNGMGKQKSGSLKHQYNITFDEKNLFNCGWEDENYSLISIQIDERNLNFLKILTRNVINLENKKELHIFTVSGNVLLLVPENDDSDYCIELLFSYPSNIEIINLDFENRFCFIFLQCGLIDIWFSSTKYQYLRHQTHSIGSEHTSFSYSNSRTAFYFTDDNQVAELKFRYMIECDNIAIQETHKSIPGILVCTWIEAIEQLVCLDCNNIFHQLSFETETDKFQIHNSTHPLVTTTDFEKFNILYELTPQRVTQLLEKAHIFQELNELPKILYGNIEKEFQNQQILAVANKRNYYKTLFNAYLEYSCSPFDSFQKDIIPLYTETNFMLNQRSIFALIYVNIESNEIFENSLWQFNLHFENTIHIFTIPRTLLKSKLCFIIPLEMRQGILLPTFYLNIYTFVSCSSNFVAITLPVSIKTDVNTYAKLFEMSNFDFSRNIQSQFNLVDFLTSFNKQHGTVSSKSFKSCFSVPKRFLLNTLIDLLASQTDPLHCDENSFKLKFLGSQILISYDQTNNFLIVEGNDATALFYTKIYLQLVCEHHQTACDEEQLRNDYQKILRFQCNVERLYATLQNLDANDDLIEKPSIIQKLSKLKEIHFKMRNEVTQPLFL